MKARKIIALFVVVGTLAISGSAFAEGRKRMPREFREFKGCPCAERNFNQPAPMPKADMHRQPAPHFPPHAPAPFMNFCRRFAPHFAHAPFNKPGHFAGHPAGLNNREGYSRPVKFSPDMPDEIRTKKADAAKLRIDLDNIMTKKPLDKAKALEVYKKLAELETEVRVWRFSNKLDRLEKLEAERKAGKSAPEAVAPENAEQPEPKAE